MGDSVGGYQLTLGNTATKDECADVVIDTHPTANGVTWGDGRCYAEFGATCNNGNSRYETCIFNGKYTHTHTHALFKCDKTSCLV